MIGQIGSIGRRLLLLSFACTITPLIIVGWFAVKYESSALQKQTLAALEIIADNTEREINEYINSLKNRTKDFSSDGFIRDALEKINNVPSSNRIIQELNNHLTLNKRPILVESMETCVLNREGIVVASSDLSQIGNDNSLTEYFQKGLDAAFASDVFYSPQDQQPIMVITAPLTGKHSGSLLGVVANRINPQVLNDLATGSSGHLKYTKNPFKRMGTTGETYIVNRNKLMLTESRFLDDVVLKQSVNTEPVRLALERGDVMIGKYPDYRGVPIIGASRILDEMNWIILAEIDKDEAMLPIREFTVKSAIFGGSLVSIFFALIFILSGRITKPIVSIAKVAERIAHGNWNERVVTKGKKTEVAQLGNAFNKMVDTLNESRNDLELRVKDVEERTVELSKTNVTLKEQIAERKRAEEALRESEEHFRTLTATANDAIIGINDQGRIYIWNEAAKRIFGYTEDEAIGADTCELIVPKRYRERMNQGMEDFKKKGTGAIVGKTTEITAIKKDGTEFPVELSLSSIKKKNHWHATGIIRDITERKRMGEEVLKSQKLESLSVLAGGIAHDFNNILTGIMGNISLAKMLTSPEDKVHERLAQAEKASLRARDLTYQLLTFSKGGTPVKKSASIVQLIKDSAGFAIRGSNVRCEFSIPEDLWPVEVDEGQINRVINNLIINAVQATPEGGVIQVHAENMTENLVNVPSLEKGRFVKVSIKDHGVGIEKEHLARIFDPYFTTKRKGSGLGLAASYSIIKNHDGIITVESELGIGTTFYFYLPASIKGIKEKKEPEEVPFTAGGRILIMDDEHIIRDVAGEMLSHIGCEVEFAKDGLEAIEIYKRAMGSGQPFDAVILDMTIPGGMGGKKTIQKLLELNPEIKAIVSSGYSKDPIMADYKKYGFSGVVAKPYKISELSKTLNKVIGEIKDRSF